MDLGYVSLNTPHDLSPAVLGREVESRGFESLWVGEHPQMPAAAATVMLGGLLSAQKRMWDPFLSLLAAAEATSTLRIGTAVVLPLERELFTFAKEVATLDHFSQGRLTLGVGVGFRPEFEVAQGVPWSARYRALTDMIGALKVLWSDQEASYHGEFYNFEPVWSFPKPLQHPHPPLLAATTGPSATGDCLPWADGWLPGDAAFRDVATAVSDFRNAAIAAGRDPAALDLTIMVWREPTLDVLARYRDLGFNRAIVGGSRRDPHAHAGTLSFLDQCAGMVDELRG